MRVFLICVTVFGMALLLPHSVPGVIATASAAEPKPAFMHPDVIKAAVAMQLSEEQQPLFREAVGTFFDNRMKMIRKLLRGNNVTNAARKIKSRTNSLLKKMDASMAEFLTEEQLPAYEVYRDTLKANLRG